MKAKYVVGSLLVLGILGAPLVGANTKEVTPRLEANPEWTSTVETQQDGKKALEGMVRLSERVHDLLKDSPNFSGR